MHFEDIGIIINRKSYTEQSLILKILTQRHGIYSALFQSKNHSLIHEGSIVKVFWRARLEEHLGRFRCDFIKSFLTKIYFDSSKTLALKSALNLTNLAFKERDPQINFFPKLFNLLSLLNKSSQFNPLDYIFFEVDLLAAAGYGIDTSKCVVTGKTDDLKFLSPKSGKTVCREIGKNYRKKLFILPNCFLPTYLEKLPISKDEIIKATNITTYFIKKNIMKNCSFRELLIKHVCI